MVLTHSFQELTPRSPQKLKTRSKYEPLSLPIGLPQKPADNKIVDSSPTSSDRVTNSEEEPDEDTKQEVLFRILESLEETKSDEPRSKFDQ
mgnify:CR=1 FL=1